MWSAGLGLFHFSCFTSMLLTLLNDSFQHCLVKSKPCSVQGRQKYSNSSLSKGRTLISVHSSLIFLGIQNLGAVLWPQDFFDIMHFELQSARQNLSAADGLEC